MVTKFLEEGSMDKSYDQTVSEVAVVNKTGQEEQEKYWEWRILDAKSNIFFPANGLL